MFLSQWNEKLPLKLFMELLTVLNDEEWFKFELIGILPSKRFCDTFKCWIRGSVNNDAGRFPVS